MKLSAILLLLLSACSMSSEEADKAISQCESKGMDSRIYQREGTVFKVECMARTDAHWSTSDE